MRRGPFLLVVVGLSVVGCLPSPGPGARFGPYLTEPGVDSIIVHWRTEVPAGTRVEYGATPALGSSTTVPGPRRRHRVDLVGLEPGRTYYYRVVSEAGGRVVFESRPATFRTVPVGVSRGPRFAVLGSVESEPAAARFAVPLVTLPTGAASGSSAR